MPKPPKVKTPDIGELFDELDAKRAIRVAQAPDVAANLLIEASRALRRNITDPKQITEADQKIIDEYKRRDKDLQFKLRQASRQLDEPSVLAPKPPASAPTFAPGSALGSLFARLQTGTL